MNVRLHPSSTWQAERRNAIAMLRPQQQRARRDGRHEQADALLFTLVDLEHTLRERAAWAIEESTEMRWAHHAMQVAA